MYPPFLLIFRFFRNGTEAVNTVWTGRDVHGGQPGGAQEIRDPNFVWNPLLRWFGVRQWCISICLSQKEKQARKYPKPVTLNGFEFRKALKIWWKLWSSFCRHVLTSPYLAQNLECSLGFWHSTEDSPAQIKDLCYRPTCVIRKETECDSRQTRSCPGPSLAWRYIHELNLASWSLSSLYYQMGTNISLARWPHPWEQDHSKTRWRLEQMQKEMEAGRPLTVRTDVYEAEGVLGLRGKGDSAPALQDLQDHPKFTGESVAVFSTGWTHRNEFRNLIFLLHRRPDLRIGHFLTQAQNKTASEASNGTQNLYQRVES